MHAFQVNAERRCGTQGAQPAGDGMPVALDHLVLRGQRKTHALIDEARQPVIRQIIAVHDIDQRAERPSDSSTSHPAGARAGPPP